MLHRTPDVENVEVLEDKLDSADEQPSHGIPLVKAEPPKMPAADSISHYALAEQMTNYHSIDIGGHCEYPNSDLGSALTRHILDICAGANFMHDIVSKNDSSDIEIISEGVQKRLWSWLILCDDRKSRSRTFRFFLTFCRYCDLAPRAPRSS